MRNPDQPVMDAANDNRRVRRPDDYFDSPDIETDEPAARTPQGKPRIASHGEWIGDEFFPDTPFRKLPKAAIEEKQRGDKILERRQRVRLGKRAVEGKGWDGAANDNEDFPLLAALRRERDNDSIDLVLKYRQLVALAECEPLQGQRVGGDLPTDHRSTNLSGQTDKLFAEIEAKPESERWSGTTLPGGEIRYKQVKKRKGGTFHLPAQHAVATNDETRVRTAPLAMPFSDELLTRQIDAKPVLEHVRKSLGPLVDILEDAVLGGKSYTQIGRRKGAKAKPDEAGRVLVKWAILVAEDALHCAIQIIRRAEKKSERRAAARRIEIELAQARYLGKAA